MVFNWANEYGEIINFLLDYLENEHMGLRSTVWKEVIEEWNITDEEWKEKPE